jgi:hypothetical protein
LRLAWLVARIDRLAGELKRLFARYLPDYFAALCIEHLNHDPADVGIHPKSELGAGGGVVEKPLQ